jgi:NADPH:quinone reductase-like Zn-dependent oxidoreductase
LKAIRIHQHGDPGVLRIDDLDIPAIKPNEVLIKIKSAALNHLDLWVRKGLPGVPLPIIMGSDGAGIIEAVGDDLARKDVFKSGDEVFMVPFRSDLSYGSAEELSKRYQIVGEHLDGTQAEFVAVPGDYVMPKPKNLSWEETAAFPLATLTAYHMLTKKLQLNKDQIILIWGASSGIGSAAIQIARLHNTTVITTAGSEEKIEIAKQLGAHFIINYHQENVTQRIKEITSGEGVDIVVEHVGAKSWQHSLRSLKKGGKIVTCGATTGSDVQIDLRYLFSKHQQIIGSTMGNRQDLFEICALIEQKKLKPLIGQVYPYHEIQIAHQVLEKNQQLGKIVVLF